MSQIQILPESLINKIAAGEVVERPASVIKELTENSIDAGSDQIFITAKNGGKDYISILDNGKGMSPEDAQLAIERHATSKISTLEDLHEIHTMGFRGEALAAISSVSRFEVITCHDESVGGFRIQMEGGKILQSNKLGFPKGTRITVENLFFNTPVRQKFMKATNTEYRHLFDTILRLALAHPNIQFRFTHNNKIILNLSKHQNLPERVQQCFGSEISNDLIEFQHQESYLSFRVLLSHPSKSRSSKRWQYLFVNKRYTKNISIGHAVYQGYKTVLMKNMHPMFFLYLEIQPMEIDVNVHPAKTEIRFKNPSLLHTIISETVAKNLKQNSRQDFFKTPSLADTENAQTRSSLKLPKKNTLSKLEKNIFETDVSNQLDFILEKSSSHKNEQLPNSETPFSFENRSATPIIEEANTVQSYSVIGQFSKYILAEGGNRLVIVDKHAAHERIRFEEIRDQFYGKDLQVQPLAVPLMLQLPPHDGILLEQYLHSWEQVGFIIEPFGGNDYVVKEVPTLLKNTDIALLIRIILDEMHQFGKSGKMEIFFNEVFEQMACHSAIRGAQHLSMEEMQSLLDQLTGLNLHIHCPHGRPVIIEFPMEELDKRFKRIV